MATSIWGSALALARRTPAERNRYVDLLRALSIMAVIGGHWLIAAPHSVGGKMQLGHMLGISPWTQWLTWGFQVMPVFFIVGGYSNSASWSAALRAERRYGDWLAGRLDRLLGPLMPLILFWAIAGVLAHLAGVAPEIVKLGSQAALVPTWFLSVYLLMVLLVPLTHRAWERWGFVSLAALVAAAAAVDLLGFRGPLGWLRWANYLFVWLSVHQLGYAWRDGRFGATWKRLLLALAGLLTLYALIRFAGYPRSMVGVPGAEESNTLPPTMAMLALGCAQAGLLWSLESPARRLLNILHVWAATVLINGMIMTLYLWHLTLMVAVIALSAVSGGIGLKLAPGSPSWWYTRPLWMAMLALLLIPFVALFGWLERLPARQSAVFGSWRLLCGSLATCLALAMIAFAGIGADNPLGIRWWVVLPALGGAALAGVRLLPTPPRSADGDQGVST